MLDFEGNIYILKKKNKKYQRATRPNLTWARSAVNRSVYVIQRVYSVCSYYFYYYCVIRVTDSSEKTRDVTDCRRGGVTSEQKKNK